MSPSGDWLSRVGFWRVVDRDVTYYYAPDPDVLLSTAFQSDHCYSVVSGGGDRRGLVGLEFEPKASRPVPDVRGTLWLDAGDFGLKFVEFSYTHLSRLPGAERIGGELHFSQLRNGAWVTSRWFIRMPQFGRSTESRGAEPRSPFVIASPALHRLVEEGGIAFSPGISLFRRPASLAGLVLDTLGHPLSGAVLRLAGTPLSASSGNDGRLHLDSLPAGRFMVIVDHPSYSQFESVVAQQAVDLTEGETARVTLRASRAMDLVNRLCDGTEREPGSATLRLTVIDHTSTQPLANLQVWLRWIGDFVGRGQHIMASSRGGQQSRTDSRGVVVFCNVPPNLPLTFSAINANGTPVGDSTVIRLERGELASRRVATRRPQ